MLKYFQKIVKDGFNMITAIITGASSGLGREFALAFSPRAVGDDWEAFLSLGPLDKSEKKD